MKSIDLLVPPETLGNDVSAQIPEADSTKMIEAMTLSVTEAIERTAEGTRNLAETIKEAITNALPKQASADDVTAPTEEVAIKED